MKFLFPNIIYLSFRLAVEFDTSIDPGIIEKCRGVNGFQYVTFGPTRDTWIGVGPENSGVWYVHKTRKLFLAKTDTSVLITSHKSPPRTL